MKIKKENLQYLKIFLLLKQPQARSLILVSLGILFFAFKINCAVSHEELFLQGNDNFLKGHFKKALDYYEQIEPKSSAVWHNIGNCYFNQKNYIKALICWKRAEKDANFVQLTKLFELENKAAKQLNCLHDETKMLKIKSFLFSISLMQLQIMLCILLLLFLFLWYHSFRQSKKYFYRLSWEKKYILILLFAIVALLFIISIKQRNLHKEKAVVIQNKAVIYIGPETTFSEKGTLPLGCMVQILEKKESMAKVICSQRAGWILLDNIEII